MADIKAVVPDVSEAAIVDNVNDRTPEPEVPDAVNNIPEPPRPDREGLEAAGDVAEKAGDRVSQLEDLVQGLTNTVERIVSSVTANADVEQAAEVVQEVVDETASDFSEGVRESLPWTHRGGRK